MAFVPNPNYKGDPTVPKYVFKDEPELQRETGQSYSDYVYQNQAGSQQGKVLGVATNAAMEYGAGGVGEDLDVNDPNATSALAKKYSENKEAASVGVENYASRVASAKAAEQAKLRANENAVFNRAPVQNKMLSQNSLLGVSGISGGSGVDSGGRIRYSRYDSGSGYDEAQKRARDYLNEWEEPKTREEIQQEQLRQSQGQIDSLNEYYKTLLAEQQGVNELRSRETNAQSVLSGLMGSSEAGNRAVQTSEINAKANQKILAEKQFQLQNIYSEIQKSAQDEFRYQKELATGKAKDILGRRDELRKKVADDVKTLAMSGFDLNAIRSGDPDTYEHLAQSVGGEDLLQAMFTLNRPKENILDKRIENGRYVIAYQNPLTGKTRIETVDLGIPQGYSKTIDAGDRILAVPDDWDGDTNKLISINKGMSQEDVLKNQLLSAQIATERSKTEPLQGREAELYSGLKPATATAVRGQVSNYKTEPVVQNYAVIQEGYDFSKMLSDTTQNPADDQALIYALAKALDPGSVVREGEYATAQKYSQSWISAFGKGVQQAIEGTGFLSESARKNIKKTIESKYTASKKSYDNLRKQYVQGIDSLTGRGDGDKFIKEYSTQTGDNQSTTDTDFDYEGAKNAGYTDEEINAYLNESN